MKKNDDKVYEFIQAIDNLYLDIMLPLRTKKEVNRAAFNQLYKCFDDILEYYKNKEQVSKILLKEVFNLYILIDGEYMHCNGEEKYNIMIEISKIFNFFKKLFDEVEESK